MNTCFKANNACCIKVVSLISLEKIVFFFRIEQRSIEMLINCLKDYVFSEFCFFRSKRILFCSFDLQYQVLLLFVQKMLSFHGHIFLLFRFRAFVPFTFYFILLILTFVNQRR